MLGRILSVYTLIFIASTLVHAKDAGQAARFQLPITKIRGLLQSTENLPELIELLRKNARGPAFAIEVLAQAYEKSYPDTIAKMRIPAKLLLEDPIGQLIDWHEHIAFADKLRWKTADGKMPPEIRAYLEEKRDVSMAQLTKLLISKDTNGRAIISLQKPRSKQAKELKEALEKFLTLSEELTQAHHSGKKNQDIAQLKKKFDTARTKFIDALTKAPFKKGKSQTLDWFESEVNKTKWKGSNKDRVTLLEFLSEHIDDKLIKTIYDMTDLQGGLHELRRKERIISIVLGNLMGKAVLDETSIKNFDAIKLDAAVANSPYAKLAELIDKFPLFFPRTTHLQLTRIIEKMGDAKDMGEAMYEWLLDAIKVTGYSDGVVTSPEAIAEALVKTHEKYIDPIPAAQAMYDSIRGSGLFEKTLRHLENQTNWSKSRCRNHLRAVREALY